MRLPEPLENLIEELHKLPGIGPKSAERLALFILRLPLDEADGLAKAIHDAKTKIYPCPVCGNLTDRTPCPICADLSRLQDVICVAEDTSDVLAIEKSGYRGQYMVLNKNLNLMDVADWTNLDLSTLQSRLGSGKIKEVILALNPDLDGKVVSRIIAKEAQKYNVRVTRLAQGLPVGGDIQYADEITLRQALEGRKDL